MNFDDAYLDPNDPNAAHDSVDGGSSMLNDNIASGYEHTGKQVPIPMEDMLEFVKTELQRYDQLLYHTNETPEYNPYYQPIIYHPRPGQQVQVPNELRDKIVQEWTMNKNHDSNNYPSGDEISFSEEHNASQNRQPIREEHPPQQKPLQPQPQQQQLHQQQQQQLHQQQLQLQRLQQQLQQQTTSEQSTQSVNEEATDDKQETNKKQKRRKRGKKSKKDADGIDNNIAIIVAGGLCAMYMLLRHKEQNKAVQ